MLVSSDEAVARARHELAALSDANDLVVGSWPHPECGEPVRVDDLRNAPSYWLVPVISEGKVAGAVRVMETGAVAAIERFQRPVRVVTGIDAAQARQLAAYRIAPNESLGDVRFVHDGPPGREVWLVEVLKDSRPIRWIFLNESGAFERPAGTFRSSRKE